MKLHGIWNVEHFIGSWLTVAPSRKSYQLPQNSKFKLQLHAVDKTFKGDLVKNMASVFSNQKCYIHQNDNEVQRQKLVYNTASTTGFPWVGMEQLDCLPDIDERNEQFLHTEPSHLQPLNNMIPDFPMVFLDIC